MTRLKLLIVTPRYWPLLDDTPRVVATLADAFGRHELATTILTAKWHSDWPDTVVHCQATVIRLPHAPRGGWTTFRYMRALSRWLREHRESFDIVYVMNLRQDAYATLGALQDATVPVVLRAQRAGETGDCRWQQTARFGRRIRRRCHSADMLVATSRAAADELMASDYSSVRCIETGAGPTVSRSAAGRFRARAALADANYDLAVAEFAPVAVCAERLDEHRGLGDLIVAWLPIAARWPSSKLWLIGDGPLRETLYEGIVQRGLHHQISMPGSFDDLTEVFQAADVFVSPSPSYGATQALVEAMAAGLPIVATDTPDVRDIIEPGVEGYLPTPGDRRQLTDAIAKLFESPGFGVEMGSSARRRANEARDLQRMVDAHLDLFQQLAGKKPLGTV
jgi:glycosyltransferase involved in cell wall biosynthesis